MNELSVFSETTEDVSTVLGKQPETPEEKMAVVNAISSPTGGLNNIVNQELSLVNYYLEKITLTDKETGEVRDGIRTVLITENGDSFGSTSKGVAASLKALVMVYGSPYSWENPLKVKVVSEKAGKGTIYRLKMV